MLTLATPSLDRLDNPDGGPGCVHHIVLGVAAIEGDFFRELIDHTSISTTYFSVSALLTIIVGSLFISNIQHCWGPYNCSPTNNPLFSFFPCSTLLLTLELRRNYYVQLQIELLITLQLLQYRCKYPKNDSDEGSAKNS